jgi:D-alanyl-D-alanine dipeptidase
MQGYKIFLTSLLIWVTYYARAQQSAVNKYGVRTINTKKEYSDLVKADSMNAMVELRSYIPNIVYELRYASQNNFMHKRMYPKKTGSTFLRLPAALALQKVQEVLNKKGLGLKVWDAYRPYSVTVDFWELVHDDRYVADPRKGSGHNRGIAVDCTLIDLITGKELNMGTDFDNFSDTAHHSFTNLSETILQNRKLLKSSMEQFGFVAFATEWWHYSLADGARYGILNLSFKELGRERR